MSLVEQWNRLQSGLDPRWSDARVSLTIADDAARNRAAALLAPSGPGRSGSMLRFLASRGGGAVGPEAVRRMLQRIDDEGIDGRLEVVMTAASEPRPAPAPAALAAAWDAALAVLPADWSDLLCELELTSSLDVEHAAVLAGPLNPIHGVDDLGFQFRCAHRAGYGASAGMVRRCLERLDAAEIGGTVSVVRVLCDSHHVTTQGPMFLAGSRPA